MKRDCATSSGAKHGQEQTPIFQILSGRQSKFRQTGRKDRREGSRAQPRPVLGCHTHFDLEQMELRINLRVLTKTGAHKHRKASDTVSDASVEEALHGVHGRKRLKQRASLRKILTVVPNRDAVEYRLHFWSTSDGILRHKSWYASR